MTPYTRNMNQQATYWATNTPDGFGGFNFASPVLISCRWQDKDTLVRNSEGDEVVANSVVYVDRQLAQEGWLCVGDLTASLSPVAGSNEIIALQSSPSLDGTTVLYKVFL